MGTGTLLLSLRDSRTGAAVRPKAVRIDGQNVEVRRDIPGLVSVELGGGNHQVQVYAVGYVPFEAVVGVDGEQTPVNTFELDRETSPSNPQELPPVDSRLAVLEGFVVEEFVGELLPDARVSVRNPSLSGRTDQQGHFVIPIPVAGASPDSSSVAARVDLTFARDGFVTEERRNVEIISGTTMTVTVELDRATSNSVPVKVVDEGRSQPRLGSWRFDVSLD